MYIKIFTSLRVLIVLFLTAINCYAENANQPSVNFLKEKGFVSCLTDHEAMEAFIDKDGGAAYLHLWNQVTPNNHMATSIISKQFKDGESIATITTSPTIEGGCDSTYTQAFTFTETCPKLRETVFKEWKFYENLGNTPTYEDPTSSNVTVILIQAGNSCLAIKNGTFFFPRKDSSSQVTPPKNVQAGELE